MSDPPETATTTGRDPAGRTLPATHARVAIALGSCVVGWLCAGVVAFAFEHFLVQGGSAGSGDMFVFVLLIGLFAGGAWTVSVLPLVIFGDHGTWIFRPWTAPVVGASCGVFLLVLASWIVFGTSPWELVEGGLDFGETYLLALAGVIGAVTWVTYTVAVQLAGRRLERRI